MDDALAPSISIVARSLWHGGVILPPEMRTADRRRGRLWMMRWAPLISIGRPVVSLEVI